MTHVAVQVLSQIAQLDEFVPELFILCLVEEVGFEDLVVKVVAHSFGGPTILWSAVDVLAGEHSHEQWTVGSDADFVKVENGGVITFNKLACKHIILDLVDNGRNQSL